MQLPTSILPFLSFVRSSAAATARRCTWLGAVALSVAACGRQSIAVVTVNRPTKPVWCPTIFHAQTIGLSHPNKRVAGSFDTRVLLGHTEANAAAEARQHGCSWRVINRGGLLTADGRPNRIDADVSRGIVTAVGVG
jgi:hypothetical protein